MTDWIQTIVDPDSTSIGNSVREFLAMLTGPTEFRLTGLDRSRYRVAIGLFHGNEPSGLEAIRRWLSAGHKPAVDTSLFIMATEAASEPPGFAYRMLPGRRDLNRCFFGPFDDRDGALTQELYARIRRRPCEALVDMHNNSGNNPAYGISTRVNRANMKLIEQFSQTVCLLQDLSLGTLLEIIDDDFPAVSIECGKIGTELADDIASVGLERFLARDDLEFEQPPYEMDVLERPIRVCVTPGTKLAFADKPVADADLTLAADLEQQNFRTLAPGTLLGWTNPTLRTEQLATPWRKGRTDNPHDRIGDSSPAMFWPLRARDASGRDISHECFFIEEDTLRWYGELVPIMMTTEPSIVFADCLCYLMRRRPGLPGSIQ